MSKTIYIAGPMRGIERFNYPAFADAAERARIKGFDVISPAELDLETGFDPEKLPSDWDWNTLPAGFDLRDAVNRDVDALCRSDAIALLPGWERSRGAKAERAIAEWLGLEILDATTLDPIDPNILREAEWLTRGDRNHDYGHPSVEHDRIAAYWTTFLGVNVTGEQVAMMMVLLKVARLGHKYKRDSLVDIAGYADCCQRIIESRKA